MDPSALMALARHSEEIATVRAFRERSGATRVVLLVAAGEGETAMIECERRRRRGDRGRRGRLHPGDAAGPGRPAPLPDIRPTPATAIHLDETPASSPRRSARSTTSRASCSRWRRRSAV